MPKRVLFGSLLLIALLLPLQITFGQTLTSTGLRLNAADIVLPLALLAAAFSLYQSKTWPKWHLPYLPFWLVGLSAVIVIAFVQGILMTGQVSGWALVNRLIGWFVLIGFFMAGTALRQGMTSEQRVKILAALLIPLWATVAVCGMGIVFGRMEGFFAARPFLYPLQGFMGDRNAFALLFIMALILSISLASAREGNRVLKIIALAGVSLAPAFAYLNYSLSGLITLLLLAPVLIWMGWKSMGKEFLGAITAGFLVFLAVMHIFEIPKSGVNIAARLDLIGQTIVSTPEKPQLFSSDHLRLETYSEALMLWQQHPILGVGLGGHLAYRAKVGKPLAVIDSTPLWLLAETGTVGFLSFAAFGVMTFIALSKARKTASPIDAAFITAGLLILLAFGLMSCVLQLMYSRPFWFLMGIALAAPALHRQGETRYL